MIVLDTNIISELMKSAPSVAVMEWLDQQNSVELFVTTVTIAEISYGIDVLPKGIRRSSFEKAFHRALEEAFKGRILHFDEGSALLYGKIMGDRRRLGKPLSIPDGQIIAIARFHGAAVATRNICDFSDCGLDLINPFT